MKNGIYLKNNIINGFPEYIKLEINNDVDFDDMYDFNSFPILKTMYYFTHNQIRYGVAIQDGRDSINLKRDVLYKKDDKVIALENDFFYQSGAQRLFYLYIYQLSDGNYSYDEIDYCILMNSQNSPYIEMLNTDLVNVVKDSFLKENPGQQDYFFSKDYRNFGDNMYNNHTFNTYMQVQIWSEDIHTGNIILNNNAGNIILSSNYEYPKIDTNTPFSEILVNADLKRMDTHSDLFINSIQRGVYDPQFIFTQMSGSIEITNIFKKQLIDTIPSRLCSIYGESVIKDSAVDELILESLLESRKALLKEFDKLDNFMIRNRFRSNIMYAKSKHPEKTLEEIIDSHYKSRYFRDDDRIAIEQFPNSFNYMFGPTHSITTIHIVPVTDLSELIPYIFQGGLTLLPSIGEL